MTQPTRLLETDLNEFARALLSSAASDRGSEPARARALAVWGALGVNLAATSAAASTGATVSAMSGVAAAETKGAISISAGVLAKWLGAGALVGTMTAGGAFALQSRAFSTSAAASLPQAGDVAAVVRAENRAPVSPQDLAPRAPPELRETREAHAPRREPAFDTTSRELTPSAAGTPASSNVAFPVDSAGALREELAFLERARRALRTGDAVSALSELSRYEARFPKGTLAAEATLLSVEARLDAGDVKGAHVAAARVLDRDRTSPHARRLLALFASKEKP
jgi:TolA-binding protein